jgi:hypothetical protein
VIDTNRKLAQEIDIDEDWDWETDHIDGAEATGDPQLDQFAH